MEGIEICRQFNGSLLYVYSIEELRDILAIHIAELKTKINPDIEKVGISLLLFIHILGIAV